MMQWLAALQASAWPTALRESTWGFPALAALHVAALGWFGAALLMPDGTRLRRWGIAALLATGAILFALQPLRYVESRAFWLKMAFLLLGVAAGERRWSAAVWIAVILAARGIAFV